MALDDAIVMFGGLDDDQGIVLADTQRWDGAAWSDVTPDASASPLGRFAAAAGRWNNQVVMFGGRAADFTLLGDTWTWDGSRWNEPSAPGPKARSSSVMVGF